MPERPGQSPASCVNGQEGRRLASASGSQLTGKVDRVSPWVVPAAVSVTWLVPGHDAVRHDAEDQGAEQVLAEIIDVPYRVEELPIRAFPDQGVSDHDRSGVRNGPPVRGEVDDRRRQLVIEEHVPGEVAVDQLARGRDRETL
jgi:hypothetical protein